MIVILRKYDIVPPALEPVRDVKTYEAVFRLLVVGIEVNLQKVRLISGILGCEKTVYAISGALYEQRKDDERMQIIRVILEIKNQ